MEAPAKSVPAPQLPSEVPVPTVPDEAINTPRYGTDAKIQLCEQRRLRALGQLPIYMDDVQFNPIPPAAAQRGTQEGLTQEITRLRIAESEVSLEEIAMKSAIFGDPPNLTIRVLKGTTCAIIFQHLSNHCRTVGPMQILVKHHSGLTWLASFVICHQSRSVQ